jgi:hypothetical protein
MIANGKGLGIGLMCLPTIMIANGNGLGIGLMCLPTIMIANCKGLGIGLMCLPTIMISNGKGLGIGLMCLPTIMIANGKGLGIIQFIFLLLNTVCKSSNNQNYSFWFELTRSQAYDLSALKTSKLTITPPMRFL